MENLCFCDKSSPLDFFQCFIARHSPAWCIKTVCFNVVGELGNNKVICDLFEEARYFVKNTAPDSQKWDWSSWVPSLYYYRSCLYYAFCCWLALKALNLHPDYICPYFQLHFTLWISSLRVLAIIPICLICVSLVVASMLYPLTIKIPRFTSSACPSIFLGHKRSLCHAYCLNKVTGKVKHVHHVVFDNGWNDSPDPPPYISFLNGLQEWVAWKVLVTWRVWWADRHRAAKGCQDRGKFSDPDFEAVRLMFKDTFGSGIERVGAFWWRQESIGSYEGNTGLIAWLMHIGNPPGCHAVPAVIDYSFFLQPRLMHDYSSELFFRYQYRSILLLPKTADEHDTVP